MTRRPTEPLTPFEETLATMPQEEGPADLQDRCLAALDAAQTVQPKRAPMAVWRQLAVAACASIVIAVALSPVFLSLGHDQSQPMLGLHTRDKAAAGPSGATATKPYEPVLALKAEHYKLGTDVQSRLEAVAQPAAPGISPGATPGGPPTAGAPSAGGTYAPHRAMTPIYSTDSSSEKPSAIPPPADQTPSVVPPPAEPWYDRSDGRQKISRREMKVETPDVESAYRDAIGIIEKAKGYVAEEELLLQEDQSDSAHITARVPSDSFDSVLTQLRGIGKLVKMTGRSEDRTQEYKTRGADIRALSLAEQDLVARYEREGNATRKEVLREELASLRQQLKRDKETLLELAAETNYAYLDLSIEESGSLWHKLTKASQRSVPLAMAGGALIMLPFLIVALLWKRR